MIHGFRASVAVTLAVIVAAASISSPAADPVAFEQKRAAIMKTIETQPEAAVVSLVEEGLAAARPQQALAAAQQWLRVNLPQNPLLLHRAGRAAELSGDWTSAASLYQQFLERADPRSAEAGDAITAVYTLTIGNLDDTAAAYAFGRSTAEKLAVNPRFRQFDRWFLNTAMSRGDRAAFAARLLAIVKAGASRDELLALHESDFRWLVRSLRGARYDIPADRVTPELAADCKALAAAAPLDEETRLLLDWTPAVRLYIAAKIDGREASPPLAEAKALLEKFPRYAQMVQTDFAGGHYGPHYRDDPKKYWPHEVEAKMALVRAAMPKLAPLEQANLLDTWSGGYYPQVLSEQAAREFVLANPKLVNHLTGPNLSLGWATLDFEAASKLAPFLEHNPSPEASFVRAVAAAGKEKNLDKAMDALLGPEAWRLGVQDLSGKPAIWYWAGSPGGKAGHDHLVQRLQTVALEIQKAPLKPGAPATERIAAFKQLLADFRSPKPKLPGVRGRVVQALSVTPEVLPELLKDGSIEARQFVAAVLTSDFDGEKTPLSGDPQVRGLPTTVYDPLFSRLMARHGQNIDYLKKANLYRSHPLESVLRKTVAEQVASPSLDPAIVIAWINARGPADTMLPADVDAERKLIEALVKSPAWKTFPIEARFAVRTAFPQVALSPGELAIRTAADPSAICKDFLSLPKSADAAATAAALRTAIEGLSRSPVRCEMVGLEKLADFSPDVIGAPEVIAELATLADTLRSLSAPAVIGQRLMPSLIVGRDELTLERMAAWLWRSIETGRANSDLLTNRADALVAERPSAASTLAVCGIGTIARHKHGHAWFNAGVDIPRLQSIRGKAAVKLGLVVIPVSPDHPTYPAWQSQAEWLTGNEDAAGALLDENHDVFLTIHRQLSVPYLMWALRRSINSRDADRQESIIKPLLSWTAEPVNPFTPDERVRLELAYGDIAVQRGQLPEAFAIFGRIRGNPAFKDLVSRHEATLRQVAVAQATKDFETAIATLEELDGERIPELWAPVRHARAEVFFDMEEYDDAAKVVEAILARSPDDADAKILLAKVQVARQQLFDATDIEVGSATGQETLVPGERLKVTLDDPTLAVSGVGTEIEVSVWASSGDRESFLLPRFGDQKSKFRGEVPTGLGAAAPGDGVLQVIGDDEIFYAYSDRFRQKLPGLPDTRGGPITVASDAMLMASARKLPSEAEQRMADVRAVMDKIGVSEERAVRMLAGNDSKATAKGDRGINIARVAKPGNPIHVRVIDPDKSRTVGIDEAVVSVVTSSGDAVSRVVLRETGPFTGWFEGDVPTAGAQASAFAPNSAPGRDPNAVISPGSYPVWKPVPVKGATPSFTIDLNDNLPLGEMTIRASESGARLTKFIVRTAITSGDWTTVAVQPKNLLAVDNPSRPSVTVLNDTDHHHVHNTRKVHELHEMAPHADGGWLTQQFAQGTAMNVPGPSDAFPASIPKAVDWKRQGHHPVSHVIYRFRGWFYEPAQVSRRFKLDLGAFQIPPGTHPSVNHPADYLLAVDGRPITTPGGPLEGEISLAPGVHRFEIWSTGWVTSIGFGRTAALQANLNADNPAALVACPDGFFDPASFPPGAAPLRNPPATITASTDGTEFSVKFAEGSRGRFIRLDLVAHEGPVPSLDKITLTKPDGGRILPVAADFATLRKNTTLEILPGDTLAIRHVDDRFVTKAKETQERSLDVAFTDARVEFADMEPRFNSRSGEMEPYYEPLIRFRHGEPLSLAIHDADMDATVEPDTVAVTLASKAGGKRELKAVETGDSTGVFKVVVTPVAGPPKGETEFQVDVGGRLAALYKDRENNSPGVPMERTGTILHAAFAAPRLLLAQARVTPVAAQPAGPQTVNTPKPVNRPRWQITNTLIPSDKLPEGGFAAVTGLNLFAELVAPNLLLRPTSEVTIYAQTESGRRLAGAGAAQEKAGFDISVPGTIALTCGIKPARIDARISLRDTRIPLLDIYTGGTIWSAFPVQRNDRFFLTVPLVAGVIPDHGVLSEEEKKERQVAAAAILDSSVMPEIDGALVVRPGDRVHLAMQYDDPSGGVKWLTASTGVITHPAFDLVADDGIETTTAAFVGESLLPRVVDYGADVSDETDTVSVLFQAKSGAKAQVVLHETAPHSGIFQAACTLTYASAQGQAPPDEFGGPSAPSQPLPVVYGDMVAARYTDRVGVSPDTSFVSISKGADGTIAPFSKTYGDAEIAARTQFSLAEAYLEMAKRHRGLGQIETADQEYAAAKQMLSSVMNSFPDPDTRAHAEFLLGNLTLEEAKAAKDPASREAILRSALARFMSVTGTYPDTLHASKAQFATAMVYEALGEPEIAAQDYVKLAYKYPDSEYLAKAMARLGTFFLMRAAAIEKKAAPFLERAETDPEAKFQSEKLREEAIIEYMKTAKIFGRLHERFPSHELAGPAGLQAGEASMRAGQTQRALDTFLKVSRDQAYDGPKIRARAMYWAGTCYQKLRQPMAAFSIYKRLTYDFPESDWAKNAIGQLSQPALADLESKLELERLEAQQE